MKKLKKAFESVRIKLFLTLSAVILSIILFLIIINNFVLGTFYTYKKTNALKSTHMQEEKERIDTQKGLYDFVVFCIEQERQYLYDRINLRVDLMVNDGIIDEAKKVYDMKLPKDNTCMQAIGYKEFFPYFRGEATLEECIDILKKETRHYAKRQMTWFNNKLDTIKLDGSKPKKELVEEIIDILNK